MTIYDLINLLGSSNEEVSEARILVNCIDNNDNQLMLLAFTLLVNRVKSLESEIKELKNKIK
jgi:hypothetical protein